MLSKTRTCLGELAAGFAIMAAVTLPAEALASRSPPDSLVGRWSLAVSDSTESFTCDLTVGAPDAHFPGSLDCSKGQVEVKGSVDGNRFDFNFQIGNGESVFYEGVVKGDSLRGTWHDSQSKGWFSGTRKGGALPARGGFRWRFGAVCAALGAQLGDVMRLVVAEGMRFGALGVISGGAAALVCGRWIAPLLFEESSRDPFVFGLVAFVLLLVSLAASAIPAPRATRADPTIELRTD